MLPLEEEDEGFCEVFNSFNWFSYYIYNIEGQVQSALDCINNKEVNCAKLILEGLLSKHTD